MWAERWGRKGATALPFVVHLTSVNAHTPSLSPQGPLTETAYRVTVHAPVAGMVDDDAWEVTAKKKADHAYLRRRYSSDTIIGSYSPSWTS